MDIFYNWNQIRGLVFLAILGLFVIYALMVGVWHGLEAKGTATRVTEQQPPQSADSAFFGTGTNAQDAPYTNIYGKNIAGNQFVGYIQKTF
jgi:hypothetical protein